MRTLEPLGVSKLIRLPHIPDLKRRLGTTTAGGLVLLATAVGAFLALSAAGWLISRPGSRVVTTAGAMGLSAAIIPPALAPRANGGPRCPGVQSRGTAHATLRTHGG